MTHETDAERREDNLEVDRPDEDQFIRNLARENEEMEAQYVGEERPAQRPAQERPASLWERIRRRVSVLATFGHTR